ncbi:hypothetical protein PAPYR_353 [Paratrimastix pyriformis]|uniref:Uncharacterized protein n=1 Tax=Paratrimastix pyriformis TaxID=342808 RepID=A0ABQ8UVG9_9EUKA|nr:hypothetical protein PAPYR_353 [Paratrimastix pyriformis]
MMVPLYRTGAEQQGPPCVGTSFSCTYHLNQEVKFAKQGGASSGFSGPISTVPGSKSFNITKLPKPIIQYSLCSPIKKR